MNKNKRRDLVGFSLHNHPASHLDGVFSNWHASDASNRGSTAELTSSTKQNHMIQNNTYIKRYIR